MQPKAIGATHNFKLTFHHEATNAENSSKGAHRANHVQSNPHPGGIVGLIRQRRGLRDADSTDKSPALNAEPFRNGGTVPQKMNPGWLG